MGMDVYGVSPANTRGEYFRNNIWWWPNLWHYCCLEHPELVGSDPESGYYNDGYTLNGPDAESLGRALLADIASGVTERHRVEMVEVVFDEINFSTENVSEFAEFCIASGGFTIY